MDNLSAYKVKGIREAIERRGARLLYLPPYSPNFSPIESATGGLVQGQDFAEEGQGSHIGCVYPRH